MAEWFAVRCQVGMTWPKLGKAAVTVEARPASGLGADWPVVHLQVKVADLIPWPGEDPDDEGAETFGEPPG